MIKQTVPHSVLKIAKVRVKLNLRRVKFMEVPTQVNLNLLINSLKSYKAIVDKATR